LSPNKQNPSFLEQLTLPENLYWAWLKVRNAFRNGDSWFDELELAKFEANLEAELISIKKAFLSKNYKMNPIEPLPLPKKPEENGIPLIRQAYWFSIRDQVAWMALINIIGPLLDYKMPKWSYGNRLYRPAWIDDKTGRLKIGRYRHSSGNIYRKWRQSWPLFRRHIYFTVRFMSGITGLNDLSQTDKDHLQLELDLSEERRLPYLKNNYWDPKIKSPHWASIDFKQFYPNVNTNILINNLRTYLDDFPERDFSVILNLFKQLLVFKIDFAGWSTEELFQYYNGKQHEKIASGIPVGLLVAGFLSNLAMLNIDTKVNGYIYNQLKGQVAHFRFVDDHILLASSFENLMEWLSIYKSIIKSETDKIVINPKKTQPQELQKYLSTIHNKGSREYKTDRQKAINKTKLNRHFPSPLMTTTLAMISGLACEEFELLNEQDQTRFMNDIKHLLLGDIADDEMREDSRFAFAATMLARHIPFRALELLRIKELIEIQNRNKHELEKDVRKYGDIFLSTRKGGEQLDKIEQLDVVLSWLKGKDNNEFDPDGLIRHVYLILLKALHEHPDKLRIWLRVLQYCSRTGHSDFALFVFEYSKTKKDNPISATYFRAFILQLISKLIIKSAKNIINTDDLLIRRITSARFLKGILTSLPIFMKSISSKKYEVSSEQMVRSSIGTVSLMLRHFKTESSQLKKAISKLKLDEYINKAGGYDWNKKSTYINFKSEQYDVSSLIWWSEAISNGPLNLCSGIVWEKAIKYLRIDNMNSWNLFTKYPNNIKLQHFNKIDNEKLKRVHL